LALWILAGIFFPNFLKPLLVFLKMEGKKKPWKFWQGPLRTRPNGFSEKIKMPNIGSNLVVCRWNAYWLVANELDLGVLIACQVRFTVVFQRNEKIKKGGALPSKWCSLDGSLFLQVNDDIDPIAKILGVKTLVGVLGLLSNKDQVNPNQ
jgi:hypothetical protein